MILSTLGMLLLAIYLEGVLPVFFPTFSAHFMVFTLLMVYPLFIEKRKTYLTFLFLATIIYDILYTNILFLHTILLFCIYLTMEKNLRKLDLLAVIGYYFLYQFLLFSSFYLCGMVQDPIALGASLLTSILPNILYIFLLYVVFQKHYRKLGGRIFS